MFNILTSFISDNGKTSKTKNKKGKVVMGRARIANSTKFLNSMLRGASVSWSDAQTKFKVVRKSWVRLASRKCKSIGVTVTICQM
jgi:hypothetical protein